MLIMMMITLLQQCVKNLYTDCCECTQNVRFKYKMSTTTTVRYQRLRFGEFLADIGRFINYIYLLTYSLHFTLVLPRWWMVWEPQLPNLVACRSDRSQSWRGSSLWQVMSPSPLDPYKHNMIQFTCSAHHLYNKASFIIESDIAKCAATSHNRT